MMISALIDHKKFKPISQLQCIQFYSTSDTVSKITAKLSKKS